MQMQEEHRTSEAFTPSLSPPVADVLSDPGWWAACFPCPVEPLYDQLDDEFRNLSTVETPPPSTPQPCVDCVDLTADEEDSCLLDAGVVVEPPPDDDNNNGNWLDLIDFTADQEQEWSDYADITVEPPPNSKMLQEEHYVVDQEWGADSCNLGTTVQPPQMIISNKGLDHSDFDVGSPISILEAVPLSAKARNLSPEFHTIKKVPVSNGRRSRERNNWTREEQKLFLKGLEVCGAGDWKSISKQFVKTKSNIQITSHAQKYFNRLKLDGPDARKKRRKSIHDIVLLDYQTIDP